MKYAPLWLFLFALALRLVLIGLTGLDGLYGQDAFAYYNCAANIVQSHSVPCGDFYWPMGYPVLAALFMFLTHAMPFGAQLASVVAGAAVAPLAYWIVFEGELAGAARADEPRMAVAAGLIAALCGGLLQSSIEVMSDASGLFWATLSACLLLRWGRTGSTDRWQPLWLVLAASALAFAVVTRWIFGGLVLPFGAFAALIGYRRLVREAPREKSRLSVVLLSVAAAGIAFLAVLLPQLYLNAHSGAPVLKHGWVVNWSPLSAIHSSFDNPDGHFEYRWPPLLYYAEPFVHPVFLFPLLTPCVFVGAWQLRRAPALILLGGWIATLYLYLSGVPYENARFGLAFFAPIAVLAAVGLFRIALPERLRSVPWRWSLLAVALLLALPFTWRSLAQFRSLVGSQTEAIRYLKGRVAPDSIVVSFELSISLQHYTNFAVVDLYDQSPATLRTAVCKGSPAFLYVEPDKLNSQWVGKSPAQNFHWLQQAVGLQEQGRWAGWTLYRVQSCNAT
jgi:4-amino-4-deoxy-L-arabinose transferase-like glycosyltransferase